MDHHLLVHESYVCFNTHILSSAHVLLLVDDFIEMSPVKTLKSDFECTPHISQAANNFPWSAQLAFAAFKIQYPYVITFMT